MRRVLLVGVYLLAAGCAAAGEAEQPSGSRGAGPREGGARLGLSLVDKQFDHGMAELWCVTESREAARGGRWSASERLEFLGGCREAIDVLKSTAY